ncbi:uncharacterized protein LOC121862698 [Homarus americanus]|uniref:Uncharacterized protein n=1 Tax=Homarus americanus TaxID=6706 RepID=A0A8J5TV04_HOMAM|nr:uncharacterized protein LOC121862698 [Homarus americanus]KAG7177723.1 hypothetical protein Hamer_G008392 [Homarus americanus]
MSTPLQRVCDFPNFTQQAYRYGIALSCIGVLLNWLGVAQEYIEPVRYLGVGLVIIGSFLIIAAMCRWMCLTPHPSTVHEVNPDGAGDLHVITVPMSRSQVTLRTPGTSRASQGKPPDYFLVTEKPPSYEEAMSMLPPYSATRSGSLQLNTEGGLEDFLAPHQVPESQPEGATGGSLQQPNMRMETGNHEESECSVGPLPPPPAYSSQVSLCASLSTGGNSDNSCPPLEDNTNNLDTSTYTQIHTLDAGNQGVPTSPVHPPEVNTNEQTTTESIEPPEKCPKIDQTPSSTDSGNDK